MDHFEEAKRQGQTAGQGAGLPGAIGRNFLLDLLGRQRATQGLSGHAECLPLEVCVE